MSYTIISAQYANEDNTAAVIQTEEAAAVLISQADTPDLWADMLISVTPSAYVAPEPQQAPSAVEKLTAFLAANPDVRALIGA